MSLKLLKHQQRWVFTLTFLCMVGRHSGMEGWYMVKPQVSLASGFTGTILGSIDTAFLISYAIGNFVGGSLGDSTSLKNVVGWSMVLTGVSYYCVVLLGLFEIYQASLYIALFTLNGFLQSAVWPGCVAILSNWFSSENRGRIMGIWASNSSVGDIAGALIASLLQTFLHFSWPVVMFGTASISVIVGVMFLLTVEERPKKEIFDLAFAENLSAEPMMDRPSTWKQVKRGIPFLDAWLIQGVLICSFGYIGAKILNYGLIMWLPYYVEVGLHGAGHKGPLAGLFDVGGIIGSAVAGWASDKVGQRCLVVLICTSLSIPLLVMFEALTEETIWVAYFIVPASGFVIWGASNLICSAISADLAQGAGSSRQEALSTVAGIVNGTGSIGAAVGQLAVRSTQIGYLQGYGWGHVFYFLLVMAGFSMSLLGILTYQEITRKRAERSQEKLKA